MKLRVSSSQCPLLTAPRTASGVADAEHDVAASFRVGVLRKTPLVEFTSVK